VSLLWIVGGILVAALGLTDIFLSVLHYENPGLLARPTYRAVWAFARAVTAALPGRPRALIRSMVAPGMIVMTLNTFASTYP
jgi:hypothetical protein